MIRNYSSYQASFYLINHEHKTSIDEQKDKKTVEMKLQKKYFVTVGWNFNRVHTSFGEIKEFEIRSTGQLEVETGTILLPTILSRKLVYKCV